MSRLTAGPQAQCRRTPPKVGAGTLPHPRNPCITAARIVLQGHCRPAAFLTMFDTVVSYLLPFSFTLLVACAMTSTLCGLILVLFKLRATNLALRHPYLDQHPWERYPVGIKAAILMDYFFRLALPRSHFWIVGNANRLLAHVNPREVPSNIKWPLLGFWGGCFIGLIAMAVLWILILLKM